MQQFFNSVPPVGQSTIVPPNWRYIREGLERNLNTTVEYYNSRPMAVKSNHFLLRLVTSLGVSFSHPLERYHQIVEFKALGFSMGFKMTSSIYKGSIFRGIFYGENSAEVLIATDEEFDPFEVYDNWQKYSPVRVLHHNKSDLNFLLPNGKSTGSDTGISVFTINIPMIAVMFKAFLEKEVVDFKKDPNNTLAPAAHFIHRWILPGMLKSQTDVALFNRAFNIATGTPHSEANRAHPFYLTDYKLGVDAVYNDLVNHFKGSNKHFKDILRSFHGLSGSFEQIFRLPDVVSTRQVVWSEVVARIRALEFLTTLLKDGGRSNNGEILNEMFRMFKYYSSDNTLRSALPVDYMNDLDMSIDNILRSTGSI